MTLLTKKSDIIEWLGNYGVENYTLKADPIYGFKVDVARHVKLEDKSLQSIDVKFGSVTGYFDCNFNRLTSLIGCPDFVGHNFDCSENNLTNLKGVPLIIMGGFKAIANNLHCLDYLPESVGRTTWLLANPKLGIYQNISDMKKIKVMLEREKIDNQLSGSYPSKVLKI